MWDQIRRNRRNSILMLAAMAAVLMLLGWLLAEGFLAQGAGPLGVAIALAIWLIMCAVAFAGGDKIVLNMAGAREIQKADSPQLFNVVEEMTIAAGLPSMPKVYIVDQTAPNAFAVGRPGHCAVAVTSGLLMRLNRDELQGVVAHEIGHIANRDTRFMVLAGVTLGAIVLLSHGMLRTAIFSGGGRRSGRRGGGGGGGGGAIMIIALLAAILAPILTQILYFACSRKREFLADASGARFTRYPQGLASALEKIAHDASVSREAKEVNHVVAPMYTVNPLSLRGQSGLFSTHPDTGQRVAVLRAMGGGAGYADYNAAFKTVTHKSVLGRTTLDGAEQVSLRGPSAAPEESAVEKTRKTVDILHKLEGMLFLSCACGMTMKVPSAYQGKEVACPRCSRPHLVPMAAAATALRTASGAATPPKLPTPQQVTLKGTGWQSFECRCGATVQVSPSFSANRIQCRACKQWVNIKRG